ncbi:MAG: uracil-DNA glycosylase [Nitrososphaerales archaeon]
MSLEDLASKIRVCTLCPLSKSRTLAVPGEGPSDADLTFVGEGPGAEEDVQGRPFVGAAGKYLDILLALIGLKREEVFITNIVKCRPPGNRAPERGERDACSPYLKAQIRIINPKLICTLGNTALETLTGVSSISRAHGKPLKKADRLFFPMYHPAAALHNPALKSTLESDMLKLKDTLNMLDTHSTTFEGADTKLDDFLP